MQQLGFFTSHAQVRWRFQSFLRMRFAAFFTLLCLAGSAVSAPQNPPLIDISQWPGDQETLLLTSGEFFFQEFVEPGDEPSTAPEMLKMQRWSQSKFLDGTEGPSFGYGTYRVRLKGFSPLPQGYEIGLRNANTAARMLVFAEGRPQAFHSIEVGKIARNENSAKPVRQSFAVKFYPQSQDEVWVILIQVANFHHRQGGLGQVPVLGRGDTVRWHFIQETLGGFFCLGVTLIMAIYNAMLYLRRREDKASLMLGMTAFMTFFRAAATTDAQYMMVPQLMGLFNFLGQYWVEYISFLGGPTFYLLFLRYSFPSSAFPKVHLWTCYLSFGAMITISFLPLSVYSQALPYYQSIDFLIALQIAWILARALYRREQAAGLATAGSIIVISTSLYDMFVTWGYVKPPFFGHYGISIFLVLQSQIVAGRFSNAFRTAERLQRDLEREVEKQTEELRSIMENIPQGIFVIQDDLSIEGHYSNYLEDLFGESQLAGRNALKLLFSGSELGGERMAIAESALIAGLGEDRLIWDFNDACLPRELRRATDGPDSKILEIDWHPIPNRNQVVERVLVSVRDVTSLRALKDQAQRGRSELEQVLDIIQIGRKKFQEFLTQSAIYLDKSLDLALDVTLSPQQAGPQIFIQLHTLKGLARSLQLRQMTAKLHQVEQNLAMIQKQAWKSWDSASLRKEIEECMDIVKSYENLATLKLSWTQDGIDSVWHGIESLHQTLRSHSPSNKASLHEVWKKADELVRQALYTPMAQLLHEAIAEVIPMADELGKERPIYHIHTADLSIARAKGQVLQGALRHLIRNSIDHGIETPDVRAARQKPSQGSIRIVCEASSQGIALSYEDDGAGLDLERISKRAVDLGLIKEGQLTDPQSISELVFVSGLSTRQTVSEISGRGVGLDAVRSLLHDLGGDLSIELLGPGGVGHFYRFRFIATLPLDIFLESRFL